MSDYLLLRFRDLYQDKSTIDEHNRIAKRDGSVWWGWWKKPSERLPLTALSQLKNNLEDPTTIYFVDSAQKGVYCAKLLEVGFGNGEETTFPRSKEGHLTYRCPEYYKTKKCVAWFRIGEISTEDPIGLDPLRHFVWSKTNVANLDIDSSSSRDRKNALSESQIGERVIESDFLDSNVSLWFVTPESEFLIKDRNNVVDSLSSVPWNVEGRYILHISDLHFGVNHGFRNHLARATGARIAKERLADQLIEDLRSLLAANGDGKIALVLVTGDLTWSGDVHEFENTREFLETIRREFDLHNSQIVVVPGNHDIEWRDEKEDVNGDAEMNYRKFIESFYGTRPVSSFLRIHRFQIAEKRVSIIGLNSCRLESKANAGLGFVGRPQLKEMSKFLFEHQSKTERDDLRIALVHHHLLPVNYVENIDWKDKSVSLMLDADDVLRSLISAGVRLVLHGHQHQPYLSEIRRVVKGFVNPYSESAGRSDVLDGSIAVLGGGSIGVNRSHLNLVGRNTYNLIDLEGDETSIVISTRIQSPSGPGFMEFQEMKIVKWSYLNRTAFEIWWDTPLDKAR